MTEDKPTDESNRAMAIEMFGEEGAELFLSQFTDEFFNKLGKYEEVEVIVPPANPDNK